MNSLVSNIGRAAAKAIPTLLALIGLLPSVDSFMPTEAPIDTEGLPTQLTLVGLLPSVGCEVCDVVGTVTEAFPTLHALEGLLSIMESLMPS